MRLERALISGLLAALLPLAGAAAAGDAARGAALVASRSQG